MKKVFTSFLLHGNMCYDRYTKQEIRDKFPRIYATGIRAMRRFPEVTAHIDFPGLTVLSLKRHAPWLLDELRPLIERGRVVMVGCQYAASHAMCSDEESDLVADRVSMEILREELGCDCSVFFTQEAPFHPQLPHMLREAGAMSLIAMPQGWSRPRRVRGMNGSEIDVYPLDPRNVRLESLEAYSDSHADGDFVMMGGDFELLGNIEAYVEKLAELAAKGKVIEWTTIPRHERDVGVTETCDAPPPFGQAPEDREPSPSFSRWTGRPEDAIWRGFAARALEAVRAAGFARLAARRSGLAEVDVPLEEAWTRLPDNAWDHHFEHVLEYPETERRLASGGDATLLTRAWHHLLIGLNSDASGWYPWTPRTRHRNTSLRAATGLADEVCARLAAELARRAGRPAGAAACALALNPAPARSVEVEVETIGPMAFLGDEGEPLPTETTLSEGRWRAAARMDLPAYGYRVLGLAPTEDVDRADWESGASVESAGRSAAMRDGVLTITEGNRSVEVDVAPFRISDPSGAAPTEDVAPTWAGAATRVRRTVLGAELEVFTELAWALWLRLVVRLRHNRIEIVAEEHVDMPRRLGRLGRDGEGLLIRFRGEPGEVEYDIPYGVVRHANPEPSFVTVQRFVALTSAGAGFGVVPLGGNQSFKVEAREGAVSANLGGSPTGRPDTRPECILRPDGTAEHRIESGGDPLWGSYESRFALAFGGRDSIALTARRLRAPAPVFAIAPEPSGDEPRARSLLSISPAEIAVTAFRATGDTGEVVLNNLADRMTRVRVEETEVDLPPYGVATVRLAT